MTKRRTVRDDELLEIAEFVGIPEDQIRRFLALLRIVGATIEWSGRVPRG